MGFPIEKYCRWIPIMACIIPSKPCMKPKVLKMLSLYIGIQINCPIKKIKFEQGISFGRIELYEGLLVSHGLRGLDIVSIASHFFDYVTREQ